MEGWRDGEGWWDGGIERGGGIDGRRGMKGWRDGGMDGCKDRESSCALAVLPAASRGLTYRKGIGRDMGGSWKRREEGQGSRLR